MEVRQLRAFLAVAELLHFGRAAESLFMAQAPLSRTIKSLENELGAALFERTTRSVELTPAGEALREPAIAALEALDRAEAAVRGAISGEIGRVAIEFSGVAAHPIIARLARMMKRNHPGVRLDLSSQTLSRPSMERLIDGKIDLALGRWDHTPPGIGTHLMRRDGLAIAIPAAHRLAAMAAVSFEQVKNESFVALPAAGGSVTTDRLRRLAYATGSSIDRVQFAPDTHSCIALVSAGVGLHLALSSVGQRLGSPDVVFLPLAESDAERMPDVHLRAAWRVDDARPAVRIARHTLLLLAERA
ncbi:LysR family transcriptional regulator [Micromonospora sp. NPDC048830]|uniref:LysR family transcriptional regulator n=1 Tax=Micromonospora sp. NPDC048830 TaxID=3364257 RepID=UPI003723123A